MRLRLVVSTVAFFVAAGVVLVAVLVGPNSLFTQAHVPVSSFSQTTAVPTGNAIVRENSYPGTTHWKITPGETSTIQIQAYASATSVSAGQSLTFYVSTEEEGSSYSIAIYRLGWYQGLGGRLMAWQGGLTGHAQGYYDSKNTRIVNCGSCYVDAKMGLVEANWKPSYSLVVPSDWTTGVYLAKFTDFRGRQIYTPFDVRGNLHSRYVAVTPDTTYQAYNLWGGYSLYGAYDIVHLSEHESLPRAVKVSFNRPYTDQQGSSQVLIYEADAIHWLERQGYDLSYISNIDLHKDPTQLLNHRAYLSLGHDEYWTKEMRDGVERARDGGVGLAFLGANDAYWQMRFEPDSAGTPNRTLVCYKVSTGLNDLRLDPLYGIDNSRVTTQWRDPLLNRPENALVGVMFSNLTNQDPGFSWHLDPRARSPLLDGTGLQPGQNYGCGPVGYEWDRVFANGASPVGLQVIGTSPTRTPGDDADVSNTTYYIASSGAMVFAMGSINWTTALDDYRLYMPVSCLPQSLVVPGMQKLMAQVMDALVVHHVAPAR